MEGWVGLVGWPTADTSPTKWSHLHHRSDIDQGKSASQRPTSWPPSHATNRTFVVSARGSIMRPLAARANQCDWMTCFVIHTPVLTDPVNSKSVVSRLASRHFDATTQRSAGSQQLTVAATVTKLHAWQFTSRVMSTVMLLSQLAQQRAMFVQRMCFYMQIFRTVACRYVPILEM